MTLPREVFLSHASPDRPLAGRIAGILQHHGISTWFAPTDIVGARQWQDEIGQALRRCDWFLILLSPASVASMWVRRELQYALNQARYHERIIPILAEPCDVESLSWVLSSIQQIDCFHHSEEAACEEILRVWGIDFQKR